MKTILELASDADAKITAIKTAFGAPGDWGYEKREGIALFELYKFQVELRAAIKSTEKNPENSIL